jgi:hypothetical protein
MRRQSDGMTAAPLFFDGDGQHRAPLPRPACPAGEARPSARGTYNFLRQGAGEFSGMVPALFVVRKKSRILTFQNLQTTSLYTP